MPLKEGNCTILFILCMLGIFHNKNKFKEWGGEGLNIAEKDIDCADTDISVYTSE